MTVTDLPRRTPSPIGPASRTERRAFRTVAELFERIQVGSLTVILPDGRRRAFGQARDEAAVTTVLTVHDWQFFRRLVNGGSSGIGESYMAGEWVADDLVALIRIVVANREHLQAITLSTLVTIVGDKALHVSRANRIGQAERNIKAHYDLSNAMYELFLDETMTYSSAYFTSQDVTLAEAQLAKYARIAGKARIDASHHVLEIGCGWGGFASYAAATFGCRVTCVTLSDEQAAYARQRVRDEGLDHLVSIEVLDYRLVVPPHGGFDRIVSIEMLEAVGHKRLPEYFSTVDTLLAEDGLAVIQVITIPEQRYGSYLRRPDFIQKYIFPGGHLPSLEAMSGAMGDGSQLFVEDVENIGMHYAETLRRWRQRFLAHEDQVQALGFDERFIRMWEFYLAYCEGAFRARYINDLQLVLTRTMNASLGADIYDEDSVLPVRDVSRLLEVAS